MSTVSLSKDYQGRPRRTPVEAKGIYMSGHTAGGIGSIAGDRLHRLSRLLERTDLNAVVIDVKDDRGEISWAPTSAALADVFGDRASKVRDPAAMIWRLRSKGIYVIGRVVTFKDAVLASARPGTTIRDANGGVWRDDKGEAWLDPYSPEAQDYNIAVAVEAVELGFDEIQFDYVRFPSDGDITGASSPALDERTPAEVIADFLGRARMEIVPRGAYVSAALFGFVAHVSDDLEIGQHLESIADEVDYISLMLYPSHYRGVDDRDGDPETAPYETVSDTLRRAKRRVAGARTTLRPWLQDFTVRVPYASAEVRDQIRAVEDAGICQWLLWNSRNRYSESALRPAPVDNAGSSATIKR